MEKKAKDLAAGDKLQDEKGETLIVTAVLKGFFSGSLFVYYRGERWSCLHSETIVKTI